MNTGIQTTTRTMWGFPVVTADNIHTVLAEMGIKNVPITSVTSLKEVDPTSLTDKQREQLKKYAPVPEIVMLEGSEDVFFRFSAKSWACAFTLLTAPDGTKYVVLTGEYKHGHDCVSIVPPSGVPEKGETMAACAMREATEETGIKMTRVDPLSGPQGEGLSGRKSTERTHPFVAYPEYDGDGNPVIIETKLDSNEKLRAVLMPLDEYLVFITRDYENESGTRDCGFAALLHLGLLKPTW